MWCLKKLREALPRAVDSYASVGLFWEVRLLQVPHSLNHLETGTGRRVPPRSHGRTQVLPLAQVRTFNRMNMPSTR